MAPVYLALVLVLFNMSAIDALLTPRQPCLATTIVRGPCHDCLCTTEGLFHCREVPCRENITAGGYWNNTYSLPEIRQGDPCVKGKLYRMECNTCHCVEENSLVCTKMGCLHPEDLEKLAVKDNDQKKGKLRTGLTDSPKGECVPGKFYKKDCRKCFCEANKKPICSKANDCKEILNTRPVSPASFRSYTAKDFQKLPVLLHQASPCKPGVTYRIDCNSCFCLASGNVYCEKLLCPSYDDVNKLKAKDMSGIACKKGDTREAHCVQCTCINSKTKCVAEPDCFPTDGRRRLHGGKSKAKAREYLDLKKEECVPGMVYREGCNKCYCQTDQSVRCTQKTCLNFSQMVRLKKLRLRLEKHGL